MGKITAIIMAVIGLILGAAGLWLILLGGSFYYAIAGLLFLATAYFLWRQHMAALWVYAALIYGTLIWALWEAGLDWWSLGPRGGVIIVLGIWMLAPFITRHLIGKTGKPPLIAALLCAIIVAGLSMVNDPYNLDGKLDT